MQCRVLWRFLSSSSWSKAPHSLHPSCISGRGGRRLWLYSCEENPRALFKIYLEGFYYNTEFCLPVVKTAAYFAGYVAAPVGFIWRTLYSMLPMVVCKDWLVYSHGDGSHVSERYDHCQPLCCCRPTSRQPGVSNSAAFINNSCLASADTGNVLIDHVEPLIVCRLEFLFTSFLFCFVRRHCPGLFCYVFFFWQVEFITWYSTGRSSRTRHLKQARMLRVVTQ